MHPNNPNAGPEQVQPSFLVGHSNEFYLHRVREDDLREMHTVKIHDEDLAVLKVLHHPNNRAANINGVSVSKISSSIFDLKNKTGLKTRAELALFALENGVTYDIPEPPDRAQFTPLERRVGCNLWRERHDLLEALNMKEEKLKSVIESIMEKTDAPNVTTIALIARIYDWAPKSSKKTKQAGRISLQNV